MSKKEDHQRDTILVFLSTLIVYALTMPRTVTLEDSGGFIMSCYHAGISHPPGYPLHSVLGKLFTLIPVGSIAFRVHLLSATLGALTCVLVWWFVRRLGGERTSCYVAAFGCAFSRVFWSQAIIAEVYTLHTFFFVLLLILSLAFNTSGSRRVLLLTAFVYGLSLSNHWPLTVLATPCFLVLLCG